MARNPIAGAIVCVSCGAKFSAEHARCPRCRARIEVVDHVAVERQTRRLRPVGFSLLCVALAGFGGVWIVAARTPDATTRAVAVSAPTAIKDAPAAAVLARVS